MNRLTGVEVGRGGLDRCRGGQVRRWNKESQMFTGFLFLFSYNLSVSSA